jgi:hypothetical protein
MSPEVGQAQLPVSGHFIAVTGANLSRTNTALGAFSTAVNFPAPTYAINDWGCAATDANKFAITCSNVPAGKVIFRAYAYFFVTSGSADTTLAIFDGTTTAPSQQGTNNVTGAPTVVYGEFNYTSPGSRTFEVYASASASTINMAASVSSGSGGNPRFEIVYYPPASKIYSQNNSDSIFKTENTFSAQLNTSAGVIDSSTSPAWLSCTANTVTLTCTYSAEMQAALTEPMTCTGTKSGSSGGSATLIVQAGSTSGFTATATNMTSNGTGIVCVKNFPDFKAQNVITGTFAEMMRVPGVSKPRSCRFVWGGAGSLSSRTNCTSTPCTTYLDSCSALTGTMARSATGDYNGDSNGWAPSTAVLCHAQGAGGLNAYPVMEFAANSSGIINIRARSANGVTLADSSVGMICEGSAP